MFRYQLARWELNLCQDSLTSQASVFSAAEMLALDERSRTATRPLCKHDGRLAQDHWPVLLVNQCHRECEFHGRISAYVPYVSGWNSTYIVKSSIAIVTEMEKSPVRCQHAESSSRLHETRYLPGGKARAKYLHQPLYGVAHSILATGERRNDAPILVWYGAFLLSENASLRK